MIGIFKYCAWGRGVPEIKTKTGSWQMPRSRFLNQSKVLLSRREGSEFPDKASAEVYAE